MGWRVEEGQDSLILNLGVVRMGEGRSRIKGVPRGWRGTPIQERVMSCYGMAAPPSLFQAKRRTLRWEARHELLGAHNLGTP